MPSLVQNIPEGHSSKRSYSVTAEIGKFGSAGINYRNASPTELDDVWMDYEATPECQEILKGLSLGESKQCRHEDRGFGPVIINIVCVGVTLREYEVAGSMESSKSSPPERIVEKELGRRDASPIVV